jgi:SAM-dependent methyltransferase
MVSRLAAENGATAISIDLSTRILSQQKITGAFPVCADCCRLPLPDACCSVVVAFATLHHIYRWTDFFSECARILKPGGQLYTDHDIEANFVRKFRIPLGLYRRIFDHKTGYQAVDQGIGQQLYELTEFHGDSGIDGKLVGPQLEAVGFGEISLQYHWCGMLPTWVGRVVDTVVPIFNRPGIAPALRILATKR